MKTMGKYGNSNNVPKHDEQFTPFTELCKFAEEYELVVEIEKPFVEFENLYLKVVNKKTGEDIKRIMLNDIYSLNEEAAAVLNLLAQKEPEEWDNT